MKLGMGIIDELLLQPHRFYQNSPHFGGKLTSFIAILAQNKCVWLETSVILVQSQYDFVKNLHEARDGHHRYICTLTSSFFTNPIDMLEENRRVLLL